MNLQDPSSEQSSAESGAEDADTSIMRLHFNDSHWMHIENILNERYTNEDWSINEAVELAYNLGMKEMLEAVEKMDEKWEQQIIEHCDFVLEDSGGANEEYNQGFADMEKVILKGFEHRKIKLAEMKEELK